ncbi:S8 family serine peptidase [Streptomyces spororaveus]|uniref:S8 family peptidase n=1 Tax=Streptomyces spororaveus TaxID=284039 RepID=UPI0036A8A31B
MGHVSDAVPTVPAGTDADPLLGWPWSLTGLDRLMALGSGDRWIAIAVLDGPVATGHPGLAASVVQIRPGACRVAHSAACRHGTAVAGILGAARGTVVSGLCPGSPLLVRPVFGEDAGAFQPEELAAGIVDAVATGARVVNVSAAFTGTVPVGNRGLTQALDHAAGHGVLVVAAAGNESRIGGSPLLTHPWVVPVASCDASGALLAGSNIGASIARRGLRAPGVNVPTLDPDGGFTYLSGTSAAAPQVTGAIALAWSAFPGAPAAAVRAAVTGDARRTGPVPPLLDAPALYRHLAATFQRGQR